jgi:hypothetical protein
MKKPYQALIHELLDKQPRRHRKAGSVLEKKRLAALLPLTICFLGRKAVLQAKQTGLKVGGAEWDPGGAEWPAAESAELQRRHGNGRVLARLGLGAGENGEHVRVTRRQAPRLSAKDWGRP